MKLQIETNVDLKKYNSWKVGGEAEYFCLPQNLDEMKEAVAFAAKNNLSVTVLGSGSNVLIPDSGIKGLVVCTKKFRGLDVKQENGRLQIIAMAGEPKFSLAKTFIKHELAPGIFLSGLPGDVGGGIVMNAGISEKMSPREFVEITDWVEVLRDNQVLRFETKDLDWSYRHCHGWEPGIIVRCGFSWPLDPVATPVKNAQATGVEASGQSVKEKAAAFSKTRKERQPLEMPSCGSTFVNPPGHSAGRLIEEAGLKGYRIGGAQVSPKHANFLVNLGDATAADIKALIEHVQESVKSKFGIELKTEVKFL